jgi:hypothetical protein
MRSAAPARRLALFLAVLVAAAGFGVAAVTIDAVAGSSRAHAAPTPTPTPTAPATSAVELRAGNVVPAVVRAKVESSVDGAADTSRRPLLRAIPLAAVLALLAATAPADRRRAALVAPARHYSTVRRAGGPTRAPPFLLSTPA